MRAVSHRSIRDRALSNNSKASLGRLLLLYIASCASMLYGFMLIAEDGQCWETKIGQEMLKLTIIDLGGLRLLFYD